MTALAFPAYAVAHSNCGGLRLSLNGAEALMRASGAL